jgi:hypothetical protein
MIRAVGVISARSLLSKTSLALLRLRDWVNASQSIASIWASVHDCSFMRRYDLSGPLDLASRISSWYLPLIVRPPMWSWAELCPRVGGQGNQSITHLLRDQLQRSAGLEDPETPHSGHYLEGP